ncbi:tail fiber domain-containing protein [Dyadobacter linearis]|nr:tail fiber domain-containing protein [Dyadobacter sp. CECT 9623]
MKMYQILLAFLFLTQFSFAQAPEKFSFQGVARNAEGKLVASRDVGIRISIRPETALGSPVYQETHTAKTSTNGIFTIQVGGGAGLAGQMNNIDWKSGKYLLQVEMDIDGTGNYTDFGTTQLLSVPYAIHATEAVEAANALHANTADEAGRWKNFDPIVQEGSAEKGTSLPELNWTNPHKMMWYPKKAAFRFGYWSGPNVWSDDNIGEFSFAAGKNAVAKGSTSFAFGIEAKAIGPGSLAIGSSSEAGTGAVSLGFNVKATGGYSVGIGSEVNSTKYHSIAIGRSLESHSPDGIVLGVANDISDEPSDEIEQTQRLFQIGNGLAFSSIRRNALTILRNGNVGIGNNVLAPTHILDVGSRIRLRSNNGGNTAGLFLDDLNSVPYCFIGSVNNSEAGFYFEEGTAWRFKVHNNGSAWLAGTLTQNSDIRLKEYLKPLSGSLGKLYDLKGYHYQWKDKTKSQALQTGLIAQEVETVFPELVETDKDGFKSVNYIGLIPHLLEAVKELKQENSRLSDENVKLTSKANEFGDLKKRLEAIEASLAKDPAISVK